MTILSRVIFCKLIYGREKKKWSMAILALISATSFVERIMKKYKSELLKFFGTDSNKNMHPLIFRVESIVDFKSLHTWEKWFHYEEEMRFLEG